MRRHSARVGYGREQPATRVPPALGEPAPARAATPGAATAHPTPSTPVARPADPASSAPVARSSNDPGAPTTPRPASAAVVRAATTNRPHPSVTRPDGNGPRVAPPPARALAGATIADGPKTAPSPERFSRPAPGAAHLPPAAPDVTARPVTPAAILPSAPSSPSSSVPLKSPARSTRRGVAESAAPSHAPALTPGEWSPIAPSAVGLATRTTIAAVVPARSGVPAAAALAPRRPSPAVDAAPPAEDQGSEDADARALKHAPSADLRVQARSFEKAPPAFPVDNLAKVFGTPADGDKRESSKPPQIHPATLIGHAPAAVATAHRPILDRAATTAFHPAAPAPAHPSPSSRRDPAAANDVAAPHAPQADRAPVPAHLSAFAAVPAPFDAVLASLPSPAPMPAAPRALLAHAVEDPSLRATVMPEHAVLSIDTGAAGELALHLRVKDGVADVRVAGAAAHTVDMRPSELRAALASEGLTLGSFQSGQPAPEHNRAGELADDDTSTRSPSRAIPAAAAAAASDSSPAAVTGRGLHVTA